MTREEKIKALNDYCLDEDRECLGCPLSKKYDADTDKYTNECGCIFEDMDDKMLDRCYEWFNELDPDDLKLHIDPKVARHYAICQKLNSVYKAKNHDYGDSFGDTFKKLGIISAVTRLSDKMNRLMSLAVAHDAQVKDEKIEDTLLDMANYAIMTLIELGYEVDE